MTYDVNAKVEGYRGSITYLPWKGGCSEKGTTAEELAEDRELLLEDFYRVFGKPPHTTPDVHLTVIDRSAES
jgi:hypothetical protein